MTKIKQKEKKYIQKRKERHTKEMLVLLLRNESKPDSGGQLPSSYPSDVREVLDSGPLEEVGAASMVVACRSGWGASEGLPCLASGEGSCEGLRGLRACCGSSCSQLGRNSSKEAGYAAHIKDTQASVELISPTRLSKPQLCQLTIGGWLLLAPDARGAPPWLMECPPEVGTGASPSSAIKDRYSLSIRALS